MKKIILACLLIPFMFSSVSAEEKIGQVNKIQTYAHGTRVDQKREPLFARDEVYRNQIVETVKDGALWIIFNDDTELFMGESGILVLDEFVYNDNNDSMVVYLAKGVFRFITGSIDPEKVKIITPVATLGIRGTDIEVTVDDTGMTATAFEGVISVSGIISANVNGMIMDTEGCETIKVDVDGYITDIRPCPPGGPSIGSFTFNVGHSGGGGHRGQSNPTGDSGGPSGGDSGGPGDGPSGGPGNGNGNSGNSGNGGGNTNGSGPGTGNNGSNNGQGNGAGNGGGGNGNGGNR